MEEQLQLLTGTLGHHMPDEEGSTVVRNCSTSGTFPEAHIRAGPNKDDVGI